MDRVNVRPTMRRESFFRDLEEGFTNVDQVNRIEVLYWKIRVHSLNVIP